MKSNMKNNLRKIANSSDPVNDPKPTMGTNPKKQDLGKILDRFKIRVVDLEFNIEIFNHDMSDEHLKKYSVVVNGTPYTVEVESLGTHEKNGPPDAAGTPSPNIASPELSTSTSTSKSITGTSSELAQPVEATASETIGKLSKTLGGKVLSAPMPGKILEIKTKVGASVEAGEPLVILEAMKMENVMTAPASGIVTRIPIQVGVNVNQGDELVIIE